MGFLSGFRSPTRARWRGAAFPAADMGRLTSSWTTDPGAINRWLRYELRTLRARSRQLARADAYGARFIQACVDNIAGPEPFVLESKAKFKNGKIDTVANEAIESAWEKHGKPGVCEVTGKLSLCALHRLIIRCLARDGEVLIRKIVSKEYGFSGRYQILDIDRLDEYLNQSAPGGNVIKMGVELNQDSRPLAYHILKQHPGESGQWNIGPERNYERVPADQIRHLFIADWPEQVRGFPWMHAAMVRLWNLGGFEEAAVINARVGASKIAVLQTPDGDAPGSMATGVDSQGNLLQDTQPGQYWTLPAGTELSSFTPQFPDAAVEPFIAACLRGAAAACGMAYHSFANDPGRVNYSTARVALLDERDKWSSMQEWYIDHFCEPEAVQWLSNAIDDQLLPERFRGYGDALQFQARTWQWIDPEKEVTAKVLALNSKLTSRTRLAAENGEDIEDIFDELAEEEALAKSKGIDLAPVGTANAKPSASTSQSDSGTTGAGSQG